MLPPLWDGFVPIVESLSDPTWGVTTLLDGQAVKLDIRERGNRMLQTLPHQKVA